ncbi:MAG: shikimate kinase AroK [Gammaproteobacteria bacterium]|nr:shikimate kinase AroK [Gammaproteobacteria bacterium]
MFTRSIFLVGMTASGKSTIGKDLAAQLGFPFFDSDRVLEERAGVSVAWLFEYEGETQFRRREASIIDELSSMRNIVLATGGGAVMRKTTQTLLSTRGFVVYLIASIGRILERVGDDKTRPLLQNEDPSIVLEKMALEREPVYANLADITFDTEAYSNPHAIACEIASWYETMVKH